MTNSTTHWILFLPAVVLVAGSARAELITLHTGDIVFAIDDAGSGANNIIVKADPITGDRTVISQPGVRGDGADFGSLIIGLDIDSNRQILVSGFDADAIFRVDPLTGNRTIVSGPTVGTGPALNGAADFFVAPNGDIFVSSTTDHSVIRVNPITGDRSLVSGPALGAGPMIDPVGLARAANNDLFVVDGNSDSVFLVDRTTGDRSLVSGGAGPPISATAGDVVQLFDGDLAVVDQQRRILRVDPLTREHSILSDSAVGSGPLFGSGLGFITMMQNGLLLVSAGSPERGVYSVDPATGNRVLLTGDTRGSGISGGVYREAVVVVPEPSTWTLIVCGLIGLLLMYSRRAGAIPRTQAVG